MTTPRTPPRESAPLVTGLTPEALGALMPRLGRPSVTRGHALWRWLRGVGLPSAWPSTIDGIGHDALTALAAEFRLPDLRIEATHASTDGTLKWRLRGNDGHGGAFETVLIPTPRRATICVSSQSGCTRYCDFCATAQMSFGGQLSAGEIVAQVLLAQSRLTPAEKRATNVVFRGMGEPLDNLDAVLQAITVLERGLHIAPTRVTVSTSGVVPRLEALCRATRANVAVSLHASTQEVRDRLMPKVARWPLAELLATLRALSAADPRRIFFIELALMAGVNDGDADAERLVAAMAGIQARINLIPLNPYPGSRYTRPTDGRIDAFRDIVARHGLVCVVRRSRGEDAAAACGQLAGAALDATPPLVDNERP